MVLIKINKNGKIPVYRQIIEEIIKLIDQNILKKGDRLPSSREMAKKLGLNARKYIDHFSSEKMVKLNEELYRRLI